MDLDDEELEVTRILNGSINRFQIKDYINKNYISKKRIKNKIEELEKAKDKTEKEHWKYNYMLQIAILKELLEEENKCIK